MDIINSNYYNYCRGLKNSNEVNSKYILIKAKIYLNGVK